MRWVVAFREAASTGALELEVSMQALCGGKPDPERRTLYP